MGNNELYDEILENRIVTRDDDDIDGRESDAEFQKLFKSIKSKEKDSKLENLTYTEFLDAEGSVVVPEPEMVIIGGKTYWDITRTIDNLEEINALRGYTRFPKL